MCDDPSEELVRKLDRLIEFVRHVRDEGTHDPPPPTSSHDLNPILCIKCEARRLLLELKIHDE